jgi:PmbA protein
MSAPAKDRDVAVAAALDDDDAARLERAVVQSLEAARRHGASAAEAAASLGQGLSVNVRMGDVETIEHNRDRGLVVTVYFGQRSGSASTSDYSERSVEEAVQAAGAIARHTQEDPCNGLADPTRLAKELPELDLWHPWGPTTDEAIELALACENAARAHDRRIVNSEGATVSSHEGMEVYGNSNGFVGRIDKTRHGISCAVIGRTDGGMQRDYWYTTARQRADLEDAALIGEKAAERTVRRLDGRRLGTRKVPVLYEAPVAGSLLRHLVSAISGGALYRKASFLLDRLGERIFPDFVRIHEQPHLPRAMGSAAFDEDGVATRARDIVAGGVLEGYVLGSYSARRLGMETTGNAGGVHNLTIEPGPDDFDALLARMGTGLLVTELIGFGVNTVTGDYSRGAAGFWVEDGEIRYPVEELTVAGNLRDIFRGIAAVGNDVDTRGSIRTGSILVGNLTVAGE